VRERQLQRLLDAVSTPPSLRGAISREKEAITGALLLVQAQTRNEILRFPFHLARGEDHYEEPVEIRLLMQLHDAVRKRLTSSDDSPGSVEEDAFADAQDVVAASVDSRVLVSTEEVVTAAVERLMAEVYGEALQKVFAKDGRTLGHGSINVSALDLKRLCKQCGIFSRRFVDCFGGVLSVNILRAGLNRLVDLVALDVVSVMAAYHAQSIDKGGVSPSAFEDGSEEQMLLKLHRRTNELRRILAELFPGIDVAGLAGATAPVLKAWVDKMGRNIGSWIDSATMNETWTPAIEGTFHSVSLVDAFASAQQAAQTFAALRMGTQASVRTAFLESLGEVCTRYIFIMREAAAKEHAARAASIATAFGKVGAGHGRTDQSNGVGGLLSLNAFKGDWKAMKDIIFEKDGVDGRAKEGVVEKEADQHEDNSWIGKGENLVGKMESMAEELSSVSKWGSNLKSLGRKSVSASLMLGKKSLNVVTLGAVGSPGSSSGGVGQGGQISSAETAGTKEHRLCARDLYDGTILVSEKGCTRMSNAAQVRQQMGAMVSILEQADKEDAAAAVGGMDVESDGMLSNDWTLSPQLGAIYDRINNAVSDLVRSICLLDRLLSVRLCVCCIFDPKF
jgi:hypothetical protein